VGIADEKVKYLTKRFTVYRKPAADGWPGSVDKITNERAPVVNNQAY